MKDIIQCKCNILGYYAASYTYKTVRFISTKSTKVVIVKNYFLNAVILELLQLEKEKKPPKSTVAFLKFLYI